MTSFEMLTLLYKEQERLNKELNIVDSLIPIYEKDKAKELEQFNKCFFYKAKILFCLNQLKEATVSDICLYFTFLDSEKDYPNLQKRIGTAIRIMAVRNEVAIVGKKSNSYIYSLKNV